MKGLRFMKKLGVGINSVVWLVKLNGVKCALKRFKVSDPFFYYNEIESQFRISLVNVAPKIYKHEIFKYNDKYICYILMEYLEGFVNLSEILHEFEVLNHMNSKLYKHFLKIYDDAENLLVQHRMEISDLQCMVNKRTFEWKIVDFGLTKHI